MADSWQLQVEQRPQQDETRHVGRSLMITPPIDEDYWLIRVQVGGDQAIVGFPKFATIGVGFAKEEDWNTNFPYRCNPLAIWEHIKHNKGDVNIPDERCIEAIRLVCAAAHEMRGTDPVKDAL